MVLGKIIAGLLAILSDVDVVGFFASVNLTDAQVSRGSNAACYAGNATVALTGCGQCLSDWIMATIIYGTQVLSAMASGLHV